MWAMLKYIYRTFVQGWKWKHLVLGFQPTCLQQMFRFYISLPLLIHPINLYRTWRVSILPHTPPYETHSLPSLDTPHNYQVTTSLKYHFSHPHKHCPLIADHPSRPLHKLVHLALALCAAPKSTKRAESRERGDVGSLDRRSFSKETLLSTSSAVRLAVKLAVKKAWFLLLILVSVLSSFFHCNLAIGMLYLI